MHGRHLRSSASRFQAPLLRAAGACAGAILDGADEDGVELPIGHSQLGIDSYFSTLINFSISSELTDGESSSDDE